MLGMNCEGAWNEGRGMKSGRERDETNHLVFNSPVIINKAGGGNILREATPRRKHKAFVNRTVWCFSPGLALSFQQQQQQQHPPQPKSRLGNPASNGPLHGCGLTSGGDSDEDGVMVVVDDDDDDDDDVHD
ncbi:hypothetical protein E2C01_043458 [Portunus trituberculatus]|uniref:Uncharacterized protein n=1 Tax=Portunus trituberculatus TaxID=210409 RepID=A0A5B7FWS4_PORTR|nr:hypothetical protein [Portunus trituberculatus]